MSDATIAKVILITGLPCSGKTALARQVSKAIDCPMLSKDEFKESLANTKNSASTRDYAMNTVQQSRSFGIAAEELMLQASLELARANTTHVLESVFRPDYIGSYLREINVIAKLMVVVLRCERAVLVERFGSRERHAVHNDAEFMASMKSLNEIEANGFAGYRCDVIELETTTLTDSIFAEYTSTILRRTSSR